MDAAIFTAVFLLVIGVETVLGAVRHHKKKKKMIRMKHKLNLCNLG